MVTSEPFVAELQGKNLEALRRLASQYGAALGQESCGVTDVLKLEIKSIIEAIEVAALWIPDADPLAMKIALAQQCGNGARHFELLAGRLGGLGIEPSSFDPRYGGYSKLFAFFRSLQTGEERAAAGFLTLRGTSVLRFEILAGFCHEKGDPETARLFRETLAPDEQKQIEAGRQALLELAVNEESQARARRAAYRTIELVGEIHDPALLRKFLNKSRITR